MKALVVGGAGFIGSHLCERLVHDGHEVFCVDNFSLGNEGQVAGLMDETVSFQLREIDATDEKAMDGVFSSFKPDYVFHLAANSDIQASAKNPEVEYRNTYTTTFQILEAMRKYEVRKLFFSSTSAVYGDKRDEILDENTPNLSPISYYGAAKLGSEALISAFSYMNGISSLIFRFPNVIGPRLTHGVIHDFIKRLKEDDTQLKILGDGRQTKPYIFVTDLIDAIAQFMEVDSGVTLYNVGVEGVTSVTSIADIICEEMGLTDVKYNYTGGEGGWKGDVPRFQYCIDKIHNAGWSAKYSSDEAVRMTVRAVLEGGN